MIIQIFCLPFILLTKLKLKKEIRYFTFIIVLPIFFLLIINVNHEVDNLKTNLLDLEIFQLNFKNNDKSLTPEKKLKIIIEKVYKKPYHF